MLRSLPVFVRNARNAKCGPSRPLFFAPAGVLGNQRHTQIRYFAAGKDGKLQAPPMVYISGEEMTHYACNLMMDKW